MSERYHFYLSFPHSFPLTGQSPADLDKWSRQLFTDLCAAVRDSGPSGPAFAPGFADQKPGADWRSGLEGAEVFVPLYSPLYFARNRTGREQDAFIRRMIAAGIARPQDRIVPVLWTPPPRSDQENQWVRQCLRLKDAPSTYTENGLQALLRLWMFRSDYERVIDLIADRILAISRDEPIGPSPIDETENRSADFAVLVAAPADWRPFVTDQDLAPPAYAESVAERLDLVVTTSALGDTENLSALPGVVLLDPWYAAEHAGATFLDALPPWVIPVLIGDHKQPATTELWQAHSLHDFTDLIPFAVAEAMRRYVRHGTPTE